MHRIERFTPTIDPEVAVRFLSRWFNRKAKTPPANPTDQPEDQTVTMDLGNDPLDPHGNGKIRKGDPLYDLMFGGGKAILANRNPDGTWEVKAIPRKPGK